MKIIPGIIIIVVVLFLNGCSHDPVYPNIGSLYISSSPSVVEILIDGKSTNRFTPAKIDGIEVGFHQIALSYYRCKEWETQIEIKPGQTTKVATTLVPIDPSVIQKTICGFTTTDMAYVPEVRKIFISALVLNRIKVYSLDDSMIIGESSIDVGSPQTKIAASANANRIYACFNSNTIGAIELNSGIVVKYFTFSNPLGVSDINFSYDGKTAYVANYADSSIFVINALNDSLVNKIKLSASPSEVAGDITGDYLYVIFKDVRILSKIDINTGAILSTTETGNDPVSLFRDGDYKNIGLCNSSDRTLLLADAGTLSPATTPSFYYGEKVLSACYSINNTHVWAIEPYVTTYEDLPPPPGYLALFYVPTMQFVNHYAIGSLSAQIAQSPDGKFLYILEKGYHDLLVVRTDIIN